MRYINTNSKEHEEEMLDFMNIDLKDATSQGRYKKMKMDLTSGTLVLSNLWNTGPSFHHVLNYSFPKGVFPVQIFTNDIQAVLINFTPQNSDTLISVNQIELTKFEGDIICFDNEKLNHDYKSCEFCVNSSSICMMDVNSLKDYTLMRKHNPQDDKIIKVDSFVKTPSAEDSVQFSKNHNCILAKPYLGKGIYFVWVGIDLEDEIKFMLLDLHMKYTIAK